MEKKAFADIQDRLLEVNKLISRLDPSIRVPAFDFFKHYILGASIKLPSQHDLPAGGGDTTVGDLAELVEKYGSDAKPSDNARLLSAYWYAQYGSAPFSLEWVKETGSSTGLTIPEKPNMTFRSAKESGKSLYKPQGGGLFKPTIAGEVFFKSTYKLKKGTKAPPAEK